MFSDHWDMTFIPLEEMSTTVAVATTINTMATTTSNGANFQSVYLFLIYIYFFITGCHDL